jgi:hypothetical protein
MVEQILEILEENNGDPNTPIIGYILQASQINDATVYFTLDLLKIDLEDAFGSIANAGVEADIQRALDRISFFYLKEDWQEKYSDTILRLLQNISGYSNSYWDVFSGRSNTEVQISSPLLTHYLISSFLEELYRKVSEMAKPPSYILELPADRRIRLPSEEKRRVGPFKIPEEDEATELLYHAADRNFSNLSAVPVKLVRNRIKTLYANAQSRHMRLILLLPILAEEYLNQDTSIAAIRFYGPANPFFINNDLHEEEDSRMFTCNIGDHEPFDGLEDERFLNRNPLGWFTGSCLSCMKRIEFFNYAVRMPMDGGGWKGCYCSFTCVRKDLPRPDIDVTDDSLDSEGRPLEYSPYYDMSEASVIDTLIDYFEKKILAAGIYNLPLKLRNYLRIQNEEELQTQLYAFEKTNSNLDLSFSNAPDIAPFVSGRIVTPSVVPPLE